MPVKLRDNPGNMPDVTRYPYHVTCTARLCNYSISTKTHEDGVAKYSTHTCPYLGGPTTIGWSVTLTTLEKCWIKLDATMVELMEGNYDPQEALRMKGVCRGMAEILAEFMGPHFRTPDEIAGEAKRRYNAKKAGESYETPGLGALRLMPPPGTNKYTPKSSVASAPKPAHNFNENEIKAIKAATEMGMMNRTELAKMYKVSESVIESIIAS